VAEYKEGFNESDPHIMFWIGLEKLYNMTKDDDYGMRLDVTDLKGQHSWSSYRNFTIGPESQKYRLILSGYSKRSPITDVFSHYDSRLRNHPKPFSYETGFWMNINPFLNVSKPLIYTYVDIFKIKFRKGRQGNYKSHHLKSFKLTATKNKDTYSQFSRYEQPLCKIFRP